MERYNSSSLLIEMNMQSSFEITVITTTGRRDFGSFHSSNVQELVEKDDGEYQPPKLEVPLDFRLDAEVRSLAFGSDELKRTLFYLDSEFCYLNHGAFGLTFKPVVDYIHKWQCYAESQPLRFNDRVLMPLLADLIRLFAKRYFKCKPSELVLVENCTFAFNSVLGSMNLERGDKIFIFNTCYGVYKKILKDKCSKTGAILIEQAIDFPIRTETELVKKTVCKLAQILDEDAKTDRRIKYIIVDHIPSNQPIVMPIQLIAELVKRQMRNDLVLIVDGAHSLGTVKSIDLTGIDVFFANCHKWYCGPKGTGFLYRSEKSIDKISLHPSVQSHGLASGFNSEFIWTGLKNYSQYLGLYANLQIWTSMIGGIESAIDYSHELAQTAAEMLAKSWSTECLFDPSLGSTMACVRLPRQFIDRVLEVTRQEFNYDQAEVIQNFLYFKHRIECPIKAIQGQLYVRISAHIYNKLDDYRLLANVVFYTV